MLFKGQRSSILRVLIFNKNIILLLIWFLKIPINSRYYNQNRKGYNKMNRSLTENLETEDRIKSIVNSLVIAKSVFSQRTT